jgi:putative ABC transport system permease protein
LAGLHLAALLILAIALANVLALQTARFHRRRPEMAMRSALGAQGDQLFRLILMESLLLTGLAGAVALLFAACSMPMLQAIQALLPNPPKVHISFGLWSAGATLLLSLCVGVVLALLQFPQVRDLGEFSPLKEAGGRTSGTRVRGLLVAVQAALALVLLCSASLCLADMRHQVAIPLGMDLRNLYLLELHPREVGRRYSDLKPFLAPLQERLRTLPHVRGVAMSLGGPVRGAGILCGDSPLLLATHDLPSILGIPLQEGRSLEAGDENQGRLLVSETFARKRWPGESPLGKRLVLLGKQEWSFPKSEYQMKS